MSQSKRRSLSDWKNELIGKTFGWLTVIDVIKDTDNKTKCVCKCKCGNTKLVLPCHISKMKVTSCGCYVKSEEYIKNRKQFYKDHPDVLEKLSLAKKKYYLDHPEAIEQASIKAKEWCNNNVDKVKEIGKKCSQFYKDHPEKRKEVGNKTSEWYKNHQDIKKLQSEQYSQWCKDNPDKIKNKTEKFKKWCKDHPGKISEIGSKISDWYKNNLDKVKEKSLAFSQWCKDNPDKVKESVEKYKQWRKDNPDKINEMSEKRKLWYKTNPDIVSNIGKAHSEWYKNNPDRSAEIGNKISNTYKFKRSITNFDKLIEIIHPNYYEALINGELKASSEILTKCPLCGEYDYHALHNVFRIKYNDLVQDDGRLCSKCNASLSKSRPENEIKDFINSMYTGNVIENDRSILNGKELDLYYTDKHIAIEFNGDYWHDEDHKPNDYHYNKFKLCLSKGILLVSVFESYWCNYKDSIKAYLKDLFNGINNSISFNGINLNNNYPPPNGDYFKCDNLKNLEHYYISSHNRKVYTCGYTLIT